MGWNGWKRWDLIAGSQLWGSLGVEGHGIGEYGVGVGFAFFSDDTTGDFAYWET